MQLKRVAQLLVDFHSIKGKIGEFQKEFRAYDRENNQCINKSCSGIIQKS